MVDVSYSYTAGVKKRGLFKRFKAGAKKNYEGAKKLVAKGQEIHRKYQEHSIESSKRRLAVLKAKSDVAKQKSILARHQASTRKVKQSHSQFGGFGASPQKKSSSGFDNLLGTGGSSGGFGAGVLFDTPKKKKRGKKKRGRSVTINF